MALTQTEQNRILALYRQGYSVRAIAYKEKVGRGSVWHYIKTNGSSTVYCKRKSPVDFILFKKEFVWRYKSWRGCANCDEHDAMLLDMDHIDPGTKSLTIGYITQHGHSMAYLKKEMRKCRVLCVKCHRKHTWKQQGYLTFYR